jgi:hypothetical protein
MYPPLVYIAGPYTAPTVEAVKLNVSAARHLGRLVIDKGWFPLIPHANTYRFEELVDRPPEFWLKGTLHLMAKCNAVIMTEGWKKSKGATGELERARELGITVYYSVEGLPEITEFNEKHYKDLK